MRFVLVAVLSVLPPLCAALDGGETRFSLKTGDRVILCGNGFIEQERHHGRLETLLASRFPEADFQLRNLGWAGDTVRGEARTGGYQNPDGLARLLKEVHDLRPTVLVLGYGMNESFAGPQGLAAFVADYERLLGKLRPLKTRLVLLSPTNHEDLGRPLPDPADHNRALELYTAAIAKLAAAHGAAFVDLLEPLRAAKRADPALRLTTNGILLTDTGYALAARAVEKQLQMPARRWRIELDRTAKVLAREGATVEDARAVDGGLQLKVRDAALPIPGDVGVLRVIGLPAGVYRLTVDGEEIARADAGAWQKGLTLSTGPAYRDAEKLRSALVRRSDLFYRRWRPFNDHSRHWDFMKGDFGLYDKEIADQERVIAEARRPRPHTYVISPAGGLK
jgi:lysophospholipase L1-like esterase